jgi:pimeloyl-ACP methyl ester carboxylesterase
MGATTSNERIVRVNGVDLCVESFGDPADPAILLIHGAGASMLWWQEEFCERLAAGPRFVVRYDHRDTGRSVSYPPGAPQYTGADLAADAVGVLDAFGLASAHLVGTSMGGAICQMVALRHPDRVASLTLISTTSVSTSPGGLDLPGPSEEFLAFVKGAADPDWSDRPAVIDHLVGSIRAHASAARPFDEAAVREFVRRDVDRARNIESSMRNHLVIDPGDDPAPGVGEIGAPTLVVHGVDDPSFPLGHGLALAGGIAGASLLVLERTGHELPPAVWDVVIPAILVHTAGGS